MAFAYTLKGTVPGTGARAVAYGTYTSDGGSTGGDVVTGLIRVDFFDIQPGGTAVIATQSVVNETLPLTNSGGTVTIVTSANETGFWKATGV